MSDPGTPVPRSKAAWLLVPVLALPIGWWLGNLPVPDHGPASPAAVAAQGWAPERPTPAPGRPPARPGARAPEVAMTVTREAGPTGPSARAPRPEAEREDRPELSQWTTMSNALEESRRNGKPVFIDFSADWCGPCQALRHEVFEDGVRAATLQGAVIPVSIVDQRRETGSNPPEIEELQGRYQVEAFPTLVVFSPATGRVMTTRGFRGADATLAWITAAAKAVR